MAQYGLSLWGDDFYGVDVVISYSVGEVTAIQTGYGEITLTWTTPTGGPDWSQLRIVRNSHGYPADEIDGEIVATFTPDSPRDSHADSGLTGGSFYYYGIFLSSNFEEYSVSTLYQQGDTVSYGGHQWLCLTDNVYGVTPENGPYWQASNAVAQWNRAGQAATLAVGDYGYRTRLYELVPTPYATGQEEITAPQRTPNSLLDRYLSVLAFALDMTRTELGEQQHLHRAETMPIGRMETLAAQLGVASEASLTPRLRRRRIADAAVYGKRKGTIEAVKEAIYTQTGYDSEISVSGNMMLDADQAELYSPRYEPWSASVGYQPGDVVAYGGYLYRAKNSTVRIEAELTSITLTGAASYRQHGNLSKAKYSNNQQILVQSSAVGHAANFTLNVPSTGTYDLSAGLSRSYDYGITEIQLDGVTLQRNNANIRFDGYAASAAPATAVYLGARTLTAGNHTLTLKVVGKNKNSGKAKNSNGKGYQIGADYFTYTPVGSSTGIGVAPTGTATNNAYWTYATGVYSDVLRNPLSGGISTWQQVSGTLGATASNDSLNVYGGYRAMDGSGDYTANWGVTANNTGMTATLYLNSIPQAKLTPWNADTTYPRGSYVSYQGRNYLALLPNEGNAPDVDRVNWQPQNISTSTPDRYLVSAYGVPLPQYSEWSAARRYAPAAEVEYFGQVYRATTAVTARPPTGTPSDNSNWAWLGSAQRSYSFSAYTRRYSGTATPARVLGLTFFDDQGAAIATVGPSTSDNKLITFDHSSDDLAADPASTYELGGLTWTNTAAADVVGTSSGMAYWISRTSPVRLLYFTYDRADGASGLTFVTDPPPGVEHGLLFRLADASNYWTASRTRLAKTVGGVTTTLATWSALQNGARIYVTRATTAIKVFCHQGPDRAPIQLAAVTDTFNSTSKGYGIFERNP